MTPPFSKGGCEARRVTLLRMRSSLTTSSPGASSFVYLYHGGRSSEQGQTAGGGEDDGMPAQHYSRRCSTTQTAQHYSRRHSTWVKPGLERQT